MSDVDAARNALSQLDVKSLQGAVLALGGSNTASAAQQPDGALLVRQFVRANGGQYEA